MMVLLLWLAGVALFSYGIIVRHLWPFMLDAALVSGSVLWVIGGAGLVAARTRGAALAPRPGALSRADVDKLVELARQREAAQKAQT